MERLTEVKEIEIAIVERGNGGNDQVGMKFIRLDGSPVPFAVPLELARDLSARLLQLIEKIEG